MVDSVALGAERFEIRRVAKARDYARVSRRFGTLTSFAGDFVNSDWDYAIHRLAYDYPERALGINSYIAVDAVLADGEQLPGSRPFIGNKVKRGHPTLPRMVGLRCTQFSSAAVEHVASTELLLVDLHRARGLKTAEMISSVLAARAPQQPAILLVENPGDLTRHIGTALCRSVGLCITSGACPPDCENRVITLNRERIQYEQQFLAALPSEDLTAEELDLSYLARATWRATWRRITDESGAIHLLFRFQDRLSSVRRTSRSSADRFNLIATLLQEAPVLSAKGVVDRREAVRDCVVELLAEGWERVAIVVGNGFEQRLVETMVKELGATQREAVVGTAKHFSDSMERATACILTGYHGPATLDVQFRLRARRAMWVVDPVEASGAAFDAFDNFTALARMGLEEAASLVRALQEAFRGASAGNASGETGNYAPFLSEPFQGTGWTESEIQAVDGASSEPQLDIYLSDGTDLIVGASNRFDVVREGAAHPQVLPASQLEDGDQILLVRSDHQRTLSELLVQDMDTTELRAEAQMRMAWITLCRSVAGRHGLTPLTIARAVRQEGETATTESVRSWLRDGIGARTPNTWRTFLAFAKAVRVDMPEVTIRKFYDAVRKWRIGHRKRGRDVVRLLRSAWFGGLSSADLVGIEERWGLVVRDLIEGSRVVEVEYITSIASRPNATNP